MSNFKDILSNYISNYDFNVSIEKELKLLKQVAFINDSHFENFKRFSDEFWYADEQLVSDIKNKYNIPNNISFSELIKSQINDKYINFLNDYWNNDLSYKELADKYSIKENYVESIISDIYINKNLSKHLEEKGYFCNNCFNDEFFIEKNKSKSSYMLKCTYDNCGKTYINTDELLKSDQVKKQIDDIKNKQNTFFKLINDIKDDIKNKYCPNCQRQSLAVNCHSVLNENFSIRCYSFFKNWYNYDSFIDDHQEFQKRAAMMININKREEELIEKKLEEKEYEELIFNYDNMIKNEEKSEVVDYLFQYRKEVFNYWDETYKNIKTLNRGLIKLLKTIIDEFKSDYVKETWFSTRDKNERMLLIKKEYDEDTPIAIYLHMKSGLYNIRGYLRKLMGKNIIACSEEENVILIHPIILDKKKIINKYTEPQNIKREIKFLIYNHHNYSCYNCGSDDKPLKIAFLSSDKNFNDLENMVPVCSICYDEITQEEVIIDGTLIFKHSENENKKAESDSWDFLTSYLPEITEDEYSYSRNNDLENIYEVEEIIKAYAKTLYNLTIRGEGISNMKGFFAYAETILTNNDNIRLSNKINEQYQVESWLENLFI